MIKILIRVFFVSISFFLLACAPPVYDKGQMLSALKENYGVDSSQIALEIPGSYAKVGRSKSCEPMSFGCLVYGKFSFGAVIFSKDKVFVYENEDGILVKDIDIPFDEIEGVAVATWGMFRNIHQLQILTKFGVLAVNSDNALMSVEKIKSFGIKNADPIGRVIEYSSAMPIFIPIK